MNKIKLTICEEAEYAKKLAGYISQHESSGIKVSWCSEKEQLTQLAREADMILLGEGFQENIAEMEEASKALFVLLVADSVPKARKKYPAITKYQAAAEIIRAIYTCAAEYLQDNSVALGVKKQHVAVYAPWNYELSMVFGLTLAQVLSAEQSVLYISLQESLGVELVTGREIAGGLEDLITYLRMDNPNIGARLKSLCYTAGGADCISPVKNPQNICELTEMDYQSLFQMAEEQASQQQILWEFGAANPGMYDWLNHCQRIYCPYQDEVLHQKRRQQLEQIFTLHHQPDLFAKLHFCKMPSIYWQAGESQNISQLLYSSFGDHVRKQVMEY